MLPKKINPNSRVSIVFLSTAVAEADKPYFDQAQKKLKRKFKNLKLFDLKHKEAAPNYLAGSEDERISRFRQAITAADWIIPSYGGTGCEDIVRYLDANDLKVLEINRPIINGFSDTTYILNYLYFKLGLMTFHYANECGLFAHKNSQDFFAMVGGRKKMLVFREKPYDWTLGYAPAKNIEGIAIGGNASTFRDVLDVSHVKIRNWDKYILFIEDIGLDEEDFHRLIVELDEKGIFKKIRALVIGAFVGADQNFTVSKFKKDNIIFGSRLDLLEYLLKKTIIKRIKENDPLHILKINNFGHIECQNPIIIPIGAKTIISPDKKIAFIGPFVS